MHLIRHIGIYVHDLIRMREFYCGHFEMTEQVHTWERGAYIETILNEPGIEVELCKLCRKDGSMLELLQTNRRGVSESYSQRVVSCGCMHVAFTVDAADAKYIELKEDGCVMLSAPQISPDGSAKVFFCRDPEGNYLEVVEEL